MADGQSMHNWSHGYNVTSGYTYGFYSEMTPGWLNLCAMVQGYLPPEPEPDGTFHYLELGCGQGFGLALMAAANPRGRFVGVDFNPEHVDHARRLARAAGLDNVEFVEGDFAAMAANWPDTLGRFHYVALHGIYSWIPAAMRQAVVDCIAHATRPGAMVYLSYNTTPGWLPMVPFQHVARRLEMHAATPGQAALGDAASLFKAMAAANSPLFSVLPTLSSRIDAIPGLKSAYAVQEYLHDNWTPLWFSQTAQELSQAKLAFVGSATLAEALMPALLPPAMRDIVNAQQDPLLRQDVMDCLLVQGFRRDIFCRGPRRPFQPGPGPLLDQRIQLARMQVSGDVTITTNAGAVTLPADVVAAFADALTHGSMTLGELASLPGLPAGSLNSHLQTLLLLLHVGVLRLVAEAGQVMQPAQQFNAAVAAAVVDGAPYAHLASPLTGSGLSVTDIEFMLLHAVLLGADVEPATLATALGQSLARLGRGLLHGGQVLEGEAYQERLAVLVARFLNETVPRWRALGMMA